MVALPPVQDPTLAAVDRAIEARGNARRARPYLGMSEIGRPCERDLWYSFRWVLPAAFPAETLKRFEDGECSEAQQATRLRMVEGVTLWTVDPETGRQIGYQDHDGHFRGHLDGVVVGLLQAPRTAHVWEHKAVGEKKQAALEKARTTGGEKTALRSWDATYYGQAILYMDYAGLDRHYLTCSSPGGRHTISVRTEADPAHAAVLRARAKRIIDAPRPPTRVSADPSWHVCRWCDRASVCHGTRLPASNCRTCLHSTPIAGGWHCARWDQPLSQEAQERGCPAHLYIPDLVPGEQVDAAPDGAWVEYRMRDGSIWRDGAAA